MSKDDTRKRQMHLSWNRCLESTERTRPHGVTIERFIPMEHEDGHR
jgi:hypothetical protein